jgi:hypothetical protein
MRPFPILTRCSAFAAIAAASAIAAPANAESYRTQITAFVPTSCSAGLNGSFSQLSADSFSLGSITQFCNTRFQLLLNHDAIDTNAQLTFGGSPVSLGQDITMVKPLADPAANIDEQMILSGVDQAKAQQFGSSITVTISPVAF